MSILHVKSNTIADMTGTVTVFNSAGATATAAATNLIRPGDWNSAHNFVQNIAGNTSGTSQVSGTDIVWAGGNNITLSGNGSTISIHAQTTPDQISILGNTAGASATVTGDTFYFSGGNNVTLSNNAGTIVFSGPNTTQFLTTAALSDHSHGNPTLALTNLSGTTASASNGFTLSLSAAAAGGGAGVTLPDYEPRPFIIANTATTSLTQNFLYVNFLALPQNVNAKYMLLGFSGTAGWISSTPVTNSTTTTGSSGSASAGQTFYVRLFTDGTGGMESNIYSYYDATLTMSTSVAWSQTNSNTTTGSNTIGSSVSYTYGIPVITSGTVTSVNAASTVTTWGTSTVAFNSNSTSTGSVWPGGSSNTIFAGNKLVWFPLNTTLTAGEYWVGIQRSSTTAGAAVAGTMNLLVLSSSSYDSNSNSKWFAYGTNTTVYPFITHPAVLVEGVFSTTYNSTSNYAGGFGSAGAIPKTALLGSTVTNTSLYVTRPYYRFMGEVF